MTTQDAQGNLRDTTGRFTGKYLPEGARPLSAQSKVRLPAALTLDVDTTPLPPLPDEVADPHLIG